MSRRAPGALEAELLAILWASPAGLTPEQVRAELGSELAYTTIMTTLVRLYDKGTLTRQPSGRSYVYRPAFDESGLAAQRMRAVLAHESDREGVLSRFVDALDPQDVAALRQSLRRRRNA